MFISLFLIAVLEDSLSLICCLRDVYEGTCKRSAQWHHRKGRIIVMASNLLPTITTNHIFVLCSTQRGWHAKGLRVLLFSNSRPGTQRLKLHGHLLRLRNDSSIRNDWIPAWITQCFNCATAAHLNQNQAHFDVVCGATLHLTVMIFVAGVRLVIAVITPQFP